VQVVRQNDVRRQLPVALDLIGLENLIEVLADRLVLDVAENETAPRDLEIWRALARRALGLVLDLDVLRVALCDALQKPFQRCPIGVLSLVVGRSLPERAQVAREKFVHAPGPPQAYRPAFVD
jgi:hypothetical protein